MQRILNPLKHYLAADAMEEVPAMFLCLCPYMYLCQKMSEWLRRRNSKTPSNLSLASTSSPCRTRYSSPCPSLTSLVYLLRVVLPANCISLLLLLSCCMVLSLTPSGATLPTTGAEPGGAHGGLPPPVAGIAPVRPPVCRHLRFPAAREAPRRYGEAHMLSLLTSLFLLPRSVCVFVNDSPPTGFGQNWRSSRT